VRKREQNSKRKTKESTCDLFLFLFSFFFLFFLFLFFLFSLFFLFPPLFFLFVWFSSHQHGNVLFIHKCPSFSFSLFQFYQSKHMVSPVCLFSQFENGSIAHGSFYYARARTEAFRPWARFILNAPNYLKCIHINLEQHGIIKHSTYFRKKNKYINK